METQTRSAGTHTVILINLYTSLLCLCTADVWRGELLMRCNNPTPSDSGSGVCLFLRDPDPIIIFRMTELIAIINTRRHTNNDDSFQVVDKRGRV